MCSEQQTEETRREILYLPHFLIVLCTPSTRLLPCCCCSSIVNVNTQAKRKKKMFKNSKHKKCQEMRLSGWVYVILCSQLLCINFEKKTGKLSMTWEKSLRELVTRSGETYSCGFFVLQRRNVIDNDSRHVDCLLHRVINNGYKKPHQPSNNNIEKIAGKLKIFIV